MLNIKPKYTNEKQLYCFLLVGFLSISVCFTGYAQSCPPNIDFETGTFKGWTCYTGYTSAVGDENLISLSESFGPAYNSHTMYAANTGEVDPFGGFPVSCPNGSGHSIRLGSTTAGGQAEGISYEFTIPANDNAFSLIYYYAVVFQAPNHKINEQPRMEIEVTNVTDNMRIECASFSFIAVGSSLPGFQVSNLTDTTVVLYKDWSPVTVDLSGNAGKTIRLFFKTADCTFRRHFGYAYIDVNSECSGNFVGATFCPTDTVVNITAPYGYQGYTWYDSTLRNVLGTKQVLTLSPLPNSGKTLAVKLDPFNGYGCTKTLLAKLVDTLSVVANAGKDTLSCNLKPVPIGVNSKPGLVYKWFPSVGLNNPNISNPIASPTTTTTYIVTTNSSGGGCISIDSVIVKASIIDSSVELIGKPFFCLNTLDSALLRVQPYSRIQWLKNGEAIAGANQTSYRVNSGGIYSALLVNAMGCRLVSKKQTVAIEVAQPGITYPVEYAINNLPLILNARQIGESALWTPATNLSSAAGFTPTFTGFSERLYTIKITTAAGCVTLDTQLVKTVKGVEIYVPTAFTPNNDSRNDLLHPILRGIKELSYFRIFNRLGQLVYEIRKDGRGWDGTFKGEPQPTQGFVWILEAVGLDGVVYKQKGTSVLLR